LFFKRELKVKLKDLFYFYFELGEKEKKKSLYEVEGKLRNQMSES